MGARLRYVVNLHHARTRHFDLRLEVPAPDGAVLASWAVPKGPSLDPDVHRLAIRVDDHDLEHLTYEDESKIVWDTGVFEPAEPPGPAFESGKLRFRLEGQRLRGAFRLVHTRMGGQEPNWLLSKSDDDAARPGHEWTPADDVSVLSGRRLEEV